MPKTLYKKTLALIRDYERLKEEKEDVISLNGAGDGQPRGTDTTNPTESKAIKLIEINNQIKAIEEAQKEIPKEYLKGIMENIINNKRYPDDANRVTYCRQKSRYIATVAKLMKWM